jgi:REP element-mobilizing transposase RayT
MDRLLDTVRSGPFHLRHPETAGMVDSAIRYRDSATGHYRLHAYVVMPNHVHMLITPHIGISVLMQSLKRFTARQANRMLSRAGEPFWQEESYDRLVRNQMEFERIASYIEMNPVTAGLVATSELFPWSSARPILNRPRVANPPHNQQSEM